MSPPVTIRQPRAADIPLVAEFNIRLARETEHLKLDAAVVNAGVAAVLADPSKGAYWVADADGEVVGQLMITFEWSDWRNGVFWWIQSVYVRSDWRSRGVFKALYQHVEQLARSQSGVCGLRLYVERDNERAQQTYQKLGMREAPYDIYEVDFRIAR